MSILKPSTGRSKTWQRSSSEGIYLHVPSGVYYVRYSENGKRTFKSLETSVLTRARVAKAEKMLEIEKARERGPISMTASSGDARTLGDVTRILVEQLQTSSQKAATKKNYIQQLKTLKKSWPTGNYDDVDPSSVTYPLILKLRESLKSVNWKGHLHRRSGKGYSNAYANQVLARLSNVLVLARSMNLCTRDPFSERIGLQGEIRLPVNSKAPHLPSTRDMDRIFAEMVPSAKTAAEHSALFDWRLTRAIGANEHSRFLAYSGCRLNEANAANFEDDRGATLHINGTKSGTSDRDIPVVKALRALLDEIRARRKREGLPLSGPILTVKSSRDALKNACRRLGLKKLGHHHLRHYFATVCIESGVDIPTVSRWLGHSDGGNLAMRVYGHLRNEHSIAQAAKVNF